jgi:hypothetical protein
MANQPILSGFESYQSDISYPRLLSPNVVAFAMFLPSLHALENHLCGLVVKILLKDLACHFYLLLSMRSTDAFDIS